MSAIYTATATSTGEGRRGGQVVSSDGTLDLTLAVPTEMGGAGGGTNPEQLFAAGWSACFHSAMKSVAAAQKVQLQDSAVTADITLVPNGDNGYTIAAALHVEIGGLDQAAAEDLVAKAHQVCPYSNATRGNIEVTLETTVA
ncbi:organic hydroperoxide resistance protein [Cellulomonas taurus]|jgi:lipoyl-dependent peroxiredoxin|uniref:organic hydroperoxide resistance protein n=1 Tax=Cellulomonas taurus TaxID=2729175 RepID=UPI00145C3C0A|nr:organic hydroperoxide resistance protein [Cellulomonas taurus]